ncbi:MAG TPA: DUF998 domain-containing protein [Ilumatobacter sp.]|nr:DUF998 domain-containing protein [Ilumatobacter sp.]
MTDNGLLAAGIVGAAVFVVTFLIDGATRPGYRPRYHPVSALALGSRGWIQTTNFVVCGALITTAAVGIHRAGLNSLLAATVAIFGLSLVASGIFPMDPMRGYPQGTPADTPTTTTRRHQLHDGAGVAVFTSLPVAAGIAALTLNSTGWAIYSALTAIAAAGAFVAFGTAWEHDHPLTGLVQRAAIAVGWTWLATTCWHIAT